MDTPGQEELLGLNPADVGVEPPGKRKRDTGNEGFLQARSPARLLTPCRAAGCGKKGNGEGNAEMEGEMQKWRLDRVVSIQKLGLGRD